MKKSIFIIAILLCFLFASPLSAGEIFSDVNPDDRFCGEVKHTCAK